MNKLIFHGHSCFELETRSGHRLIFDPWLDENPKADIRADAVEQLDYVLCSHGHFDHFADAIALCDRTGASLLGVFELVAFAQSKGVKNAQGMNVGGGFQFPFGYAKLTPALHSGTVHGDDEGKFTGIACGWWIDLDGTRLYHAGDTALLADMQLLQGRVDIALLPIGDNFTMGPEDAARAVEMIKPRIVIPMHYNTFPVIEQDPADFKRRVGTTAEVHILEPGESYEF